MRPPDAGPDGGNPPRDAQIAWMKSISLRPVVGRAFRTLNAVSELLASHMPLSAFWN